MLRHTIYQICMVPFLIVGITACDQDHSESMVNNTKETFQGASKDDYEPVTGRKLTDVAGQAAIPVGSEESIGQVVTDNALPYVGRYHVVVSCQDPIVFCKDGTADFVMNLLADGTAHRTIIHSGTITFATAQQYRQDHWKYDEINHQIILQRSNGVEFFYDIDKNKNLTMNLNKIANGSDVNRKFFQEGNAFPHEAYVLKSEK